MYSSKRKIIEVPVCPDTNRWLLTKDYLKKLLWSDFKLYYSTPYLNDIIYLHYKGFDKI